MGYMQHVRKARFRISTPNLYSSHTLIWAYPPPFHYISDHLSTKPLFGEWNCCWICLSEPVWCLRVHVSIYSYAVRTHDIQYDTSTMILNPWFLLFDLPLKYRLVWHQIEMVLFSQTNQDAKVDQYTLVFQVSDTNRDTSTVRRSQSSSHDVMIWERFLP